MKKISIAAALLSGLLFSTCSTDVDLLDDWKETTVVYGLLDQSQATQYIRIQKAYLGEGNALVMAQQFDSINYVNALDVTIEQWSNGNLVNTYYLQPDTTTNKASGIFAYPNMVLYSMTAPLTNPQHEYKLVIRNNETQNVVTAQTLLVDFANNDISSPQGSSINIVKINPSYKVNVAWQAGAYGRVYQPALRFFYRETDNNNVTTTKMIEWGLGTERASDLDGSDNLQVSFDPLDFYRFVGQNLPDNSNIVSRSVDHIEIAVYAGGDDLSTYMDVSAPSTSVVQDRPIFTNVNNGIGLFSSRTTGVRSYNVSGAASMNDTLAYSTSTCHLRFKDKNGNVGFCQ